MTGGKSSAKLTAKTGRIPHICSPMFPPPGAAHSAFPFKSPVRPLLPAPPDVSRGLALAESTSIDSPSKTWVFKRVELAISTLPVDVEELARRAIERFIGRLATIILRWVIGYRLSCRVVWKLFFREFSGARGCQLGTKWEQSLHLCCTGAEDEESRDQRDTIWTLLYTVIKSFPF